MSAHVPPTPSTTPGTAPEPPLPPNGNTQGVTAPELRAYAHCARSTTDGLNEWGGVTLLLLNIAPTTTHAIEVSLPSQSISSREGQTPPIGIRNGGNYADMMAHTHTPSPPERLDFLLTSTDAGLRSPTIALNGVVLRVSANGSLPQMSPVRVNGSVIELPPLSFGFFVFPSAAARACLTPAQLARERHEAIADAADKGDASKLVGRSARPKHLRSGMGAS
eukprot:scaffold12202_cov32-Tisochrysis_lutea.AAC.2